MIMVLNMWSSIDPQDQDREQPQRGQLLPDHLVRYHQEATGVLAALPLPGTISDRVEPHHLILHYGLDEDFLEGDPVRQIASDLNAHAMGQLQYRPTSSGVDENDGRQSELVGDRDDLMVPSQGLDERPDLLWCSLDLDGLPS